MVVMFIGAYLEDKQEDPQRSLRDIWTKFYRKKKLIILHHFLLPIVGFPALTVSINIIKIFIDCIIINYLVSKTKTKGNTYTRHKLEKYKLFSQYMQS